MAADVFLSFHLICDCCRARVVSCFIITRVTVLVGVYCYLYGSIRFLCCISISSYRTGGCLLLLVWQHSILVLYLYIELPYWWVSIVTGMEAFDSCALYLYIELPYWWVSIVTGMAAFDSCAISLFRVTLLVGVYCYWYGSIRFLCYISISSYRTGGCLLLLVWQHSILVLYLYIECYSVYICSCLYGLVSLCKSYIRLSVCTLSGFVLCIICLLNKCKKWQQTCFCHFI
jgi:hypothetical protein